MRKLLGKLGDANQRPYPHAVTLFLLISAAIFLALPETAHAQIWVSSGFKAGSDAQHITAYCSTSAVDPTTGQASPAATDYLDFGVACYMNTSAGDTITFPACPPSGGGMDTVGVLANPTTLCSFSFQPQTGVTYTIHSLHMLDFKWDVQLAESNSCPATYLVTGSCWSDPEGYFEYPYKFDQFTLSYLPWTSSPNYSTQGQSITQEETGSVTGTGESQIIPEFKASDGFLYLVEVWWLGTSSAVYPSCPTPKVTTMSPKTWFAGKSYPVTITGTGFTTSANATASCPVTPVSITAADGSDVPVPKVHVDSDKQITITMKPAADAATQKVTITAGTSPNTGSYSDAQILGNQIICSGANMQCDGNIVSVTGDADPTPQEVVVGQPISLKSFDLPVGIATTETTWKVDGTNISGYTVAPDSSSATVTPTELKSATLSTYWVYPLQDVRVTYKYCVDIAGLSATEIKDGLNCSRKAKAAFNVNGPTGKITPTPTSWSVSQQISCPSILQLLYFGYPDPTSGCSHIPLVKGISFKAGITNVPVLNGTAVNGTTEWVQLILKNRLSGISVSGTQAIPANLGVGLDNTYPYGSDDSSASVTKETSDSPSNDLDPALATETRKFKADMYYLWKPQISGSIFVPLAYVEWNTSGTGVQHTKYSPPWSLASSGTTTAVFKTSSDTGNSHGFPTWSRVVKNGNSMSNENDNDNEEQKEQQ